MSYHTKVTVLEYLDRDGHSPCAGWFDDLNEEAAAKVAIVVTRLSHGHFSNVKGVGACVFEYKIDFGPGYRVYFGKDNDTLVILLRWRNQEATATGRGGRARPMGRL